MIHENHLIAAFPRQARLRFLASCTEVDLLAGQVLGEPGIKMRHAFFPVEGWTSLTIFQDGIQGPEVGTVGAEGMLGVQLLLGAATPVHRMSVESGGAAWRIDARQLRAEADRTRSIRAAFNGYLFEQMNSLSEATACLWRHTIRTRLARRLLIAQGRAGSNRFRASQEYLASILAVRRVGVTSAAFAFRSEGLIKYHRGMIEVLDQAGLQAEACLSLTKHSSLGK